MEPMREGEPVTAACQGGSKCFSGWLQTTTPLPPRRGVISRRSARSQLQSLSQGGWRRTELPAPGTTSFHLTPETFYPQFPPNTNVSFATRAVPEKHVGGAGQEPLPPGHCRGASHRPGGPQQTNSKRRGRSWEHQGQTQKSKINSESAFQFPTTTGIASTRGEPAAWPARRPGGTTSGNPPRPRPPARGQQWLMSRDAPARGVSTS